jgi:cation diffusion facilitator CzcD-associated flavoprotein CzcO
MEGARLMSVRTPEVVVIGAGMSGLAMAVKLKTAGFERFTVLEKGHDVGGVWFWNQYPGLSCDFPSLVYRYTFHNKTDWRRLFATGSDIRQYHRDVADAYALWPHIKLGTEVVSARHGAEGWVVETADGTQYRADFVVGATGLLHHPHYPDIKGLDTFAGTVVHTARWDDDIKVQGKRIAVIGNGSTGVQISGALQPVAERLLMFQRTPQWVLRVPMGVAQPQWMTRLFTRFPALSQAILTGGLKALHRGVSLFLRPTFGRKAVQTYARACLHLIRDRELRERLRPTYQPLCKRQVMSGNYFRTVQQSNVEVITDAIDHADETGITTADGRHHDLDLIVLATGFHAHNYMRPMDFTGRDGIRIDDAWPNGPTAFAMTAISGFPNFFMILGPNTPTGSLHLQECAELTCDFVIGWLRRYQQGQLDQVEISLDAAKRFDQDVRAALGPTVWNTGCNSWYLKEDGTVDLWPFDMATVHQYLSTPDMSDWLITSGSKPTAHQVTVTGPHRLSAQDTNEEPR